MSHFTPPPISHSPAFSSSSLFNGVTEYYLLRYSKFLWQSTWVSKIPLRRVMPPAGTSNRTPVLTCTHRLTCMHTEDRTMKVINLQVHNIKKLFLIKFWAQPSLINMLQI